jgi:WD repeat-containing protein 35
LIRKLGRELAFYIDEIPDPNAVYDKDKFESKKETHDLISSVAIGDETFIVGRNSGIVFKYTLPHVMMETKFPLRCRPQMMSFNCNATKISIIDINGCLR